MYSQELKNKGLQAILMAESFESKFAPLCQKSPKALFPLANVPLILYQLELLAQNNVQKVIVVSY